MYFIVCDDNKDFADYFGKQLSETEPDSIVKVFHSAKRLLFNLPELSGYVDAIFLDINLENMNGIDVAVDIQHRYPNISIVIRISALCISPVTLTTIRRRYSIVRRMLCLLHFL